MLSNSASSSLVISNFFPPNIWRKLAVFFGTITASLSENSLNYIFSELALFLFLFATHNSNN